MEKLPEAFKLLIVGMVTVFTILLVVIYLGKSLIYIINKLNSSKDVNTDDVNSSKSNVDDKTVSIINEAVKQITDNKGKVINIRKI